jgi:phosphoglycolate phosphatase-like HAD superfamily hydrolase
MTNQSRNPVVLFDVDGTLVTGPDRGPSAGVLSMNKAALEVTGVAIQGDPRRFAGRTDTQIARMLIADTGTDPPDERDVTELVRRYVAALAGFVGQAPYSALGDPRTVIPRLEQGGALVGLGTGNVREGADIKLRSAAIRELFDLERGGFGDDGFSRADVLRVGVARCDPSGGQPVVIVGDTPRDIEAAHEIGARCIGTPYRGNTAEVLAAAGADLVVEGIGPALVDAVWALARG